MPAWLNFIINEIFGQGAIFLALIAMIGLILQKKPVSEIVRGTIMTAIGFFVLNTGTGLITGSSIDGIATAFNTVMPQAVESTTVDIGGEFGTEIGIVMIVSFAINVIFARFTKWKSIFLTGHMLYWFPYVFVAAGVGAGLSGAPLIALAAIFTALYMIISPNLMRPFVKKVTGDDSFTIGHPTTCLSVISGLLARAIGDPSHSTEDIKFPKSLGFLREISITGSIAIAISYIVMFFILTANGYDPATVWGYAEGTTGIFTYIFTHAIYFGVGMTIMLQGVRMRLPGHRREGRPRRHPGPRRPGHLPVCPQRSADRLHRCPHHLHRHDSDHWLHGHLPDRRHPAGHHLLLRDRRGLHHLQRPGRQRP